MADQFILGQHEALLKRLVDGQDEISARLAHIELTLAEKRGERRIATAIWASASGAVGTLVVFVTKAWFAGHSQ